MFEIVLASVYTDIIEEIELRPSWLSVTKSAVSTPVDFDVRDGILGIDRRLLGDAPGPAV